MFGEFLKKNSYEIEFERLGIRTEVKPLSEDELEECRRMRGTDGARYALYLACPALHEEGERLYKEGAIFSPLDITMAVEASDVNAAYRYIREISGMGTSRVNLYKNDLPAFGADEVFDEISHDLSYPAENYHNMADYGEESQAVGNNGESRHNVPQNVTKSKITAENTETGRNMEDIVTLLACKLRLAAENM